MSLSASRRSGAVEGDQSRDLLQRAAIRNGREQEHEHRRSRASKAQCHVKLSYSARCWLLAVRCWSPGTANSRTASSVRHQLRPAIPSSSRPSRSGSWSTCRPPRSRRFERRQRLAVVLLHDVLLFERLAGELHRETLFASCQRPGVRRRPGQEDGADLLGAAAASTSVPAPPSSRTVLGARAEHRLDPLHHVRAARARSAGVDLVH